MLNINDLWSRFPWYLVISQQSRILSCPYWSKHPSILSKLTATNCWAIRELGLCLGWSSATQYILLWQVWENSGWPSTDQPMTIFSKLGFTSQTWLLRRSKMWDTQSGTTTFNDMYNPNEMANIEQIYQASERFQDAFVIFLLQSFSSVIQKQLLWD